MNLIEFYDKIAADSDNNAARNAKFFSEEVTMFTIINSTFKDEDIINIKMSPSIYSPKFDIRFRSNNIAEYANINLNKQIVPGAYKPLYQINIEKINDNELRFSLIEI